MSRSKSALFAAVLPPSVSLRPLAWQVAAVGFGAVTGGGQVLGGAAPLGLALVMGCSQGYALACGFGVIVGGLIFLPSVQAFCLAGAVAAALVMRLACREKFWPAAAAGVGTMLLVPLLLAMKQALEPAEAFWAASTAGVAVVLGHALSRHPAAEGKNNLLWAGVLAAGMQSLAVGLFQPGLTLVTAVTLAVACRRSEEHTALAALGLAVWLSAASPTYCFGALSAAAGGLLGAYYAPGDKQGCCALCLGSCVLGALMAPGLEQVCGLAVSAGAGLLLFLLLPARLWVAFIPEESPAAEPGLRGAAAQLERVADTLSDIAETVDGVYRKIPIGTEGFDKVVDYTCKQVCEGCANREECWVTHYGDSMAGMSTLRPVLEERGRLELSQLPRQFCGCTHPVEFCGALTRGQAMRLARREERTRCIALRNALTEQYGALAQALAVMAEELGKATSTDFQKTARLTRLFSGLGLEPVEAAVGVEADGRTRARVTLARTSFGEEDLAELTGEVSRLCRRSMALPLVEHRGAATTLTFPEKPLLLPVFGLASHSAEEISGDVVEQFCDAHDQARMLLCDGMGTGKPAAVDGTLAARLTGQLLRAGFASQAAARLVNVALSLKSQVDSSATLDLISIDLFTGKAELFKAGAAASYLVQQGRLRRMEGPGLPMGVVDTVSGKAMRVQMREGDMAVLLSDGVLADGAEWLEQQLELCAQVGSTPQEVADILADAAQRRGIPGHPDDITVAVLKLERAI